MSTLSEIANTVGATREDLEYLQSVLHGVEEAPEIRQVQVRLDAILVALEHLLDPLVEWFAHEAEVDDYYLGMSETRGS